MNIVFFGSSDFSIPVLEALISRHNVVHVVTTPDKKKGRGQILAPTVVKEYAIKHKLSCSAPEKLNQPEVIDQIKNLNPDFIVIASYGKLVPEAIFKAVANAALNVHPSLLSRHRGASPIQRAILEGDKKTGVSIAEVTKDLDAGDLFAQAETALDPNENASELSQRLSKIAGELILKVIDNIAAGKITKTPQNQNQSTYAKKIEKEEGKINWNNLGETIHNQVRAYYPWPGAYTFYHDKRLKVFETCLGNISTKFSPGTIVEITSEYIAVQTKKNTILLKRIQLEGKQEMKAYDFALGQHLKIGETFQ